MRKFFALRAFLKNTILMKPFLLKSMTMNKKRFLKGMILIEKVFVKRMISNKSFLRLVRFWITFFHLVRFWINFFTTRHILKRKSSPKSNTCTFHIVFLHITMCNYSPQYLRLLDTNVRYRSNKTFCTLFRKDF